VIDRRLMSAWADAMRHQRHDEAAELWRQLMAQWLTPPVINQRYWNRLVDRRMAVLERREQRSTISDVEWDNSHQDMGR